MESALRAGLEANFSASRDGGFRLDLALSIPAGRTVALLGPNGAGKTTAVQVLSGLIPIDQGRIELGGVVVDDPQAGVFVPPEVRRVGVVFQDYLLFAHLSIQDNVAFGLRSRGTSKEQARVKAQEWLEHLDLSDLGRRKPGQLSGGQAQRVALARALVTEPDLLLLDEPLSALDVGTRAQLRRTLKEHLDSFKGPRLLITHDPSEAFLLADEIHVIENGAVTQFGSRDDIRLRPRTSYAADLAGVNLFVATVQNGIANVGSHQLHVASVVEGDSLVTIRPSAISIHRSQPGGSPRNSWPTGIELIEHLGERARIRTGPPLPLTVEITASALDELRLAVGDDVWVAIKATEIGVEPG